MKPLLVGKDPLTIEVHFHNLTTLMHTYMAHITRGESPVKIEGEGAIEAFAWETRGGFAVHAPQLHRIPRCTVDGFANFFRSDPSR